MVLFRTLSGSKCGNALALREGKAAASALGMGNDSQGL